jgi:hypothetical protein
MQAQQAVFTGLKTSANGLLTNNACPGPIPAANPRRKL